jgi:Flp pilus assembly protein TadG
MEAKPMTRHPRRLVHSDDGATLTEFGLLAPVLLLMIIGAFQTGHTLYMQGVLEGAVQKAARDGTLETASGTSDTSRDTIDAAVRSQVLKLNKDADIQITRRFYRTFTEAAQAKAEEFTDSDTGIFADGICNNGEAFEDLNNNGVRDLDGGDAIGRAGARDNVVYTVTVSYPNMFPLHRFIGGSDTTTLSASTVLANQPYGEQERYDAPTVGHCT